MERPSKRAILSIEVVLRADEEDQEADEDRGRINIEDVNIQMYEEDDSDSDALANNNYIDHEEPVEEAGQLDDTQVSESEPENEEDADEDEELEYHPCDWCKKNVRKLLMIDEEDICRRCVMESDLELNQDGEWDYPHGQFEDSENADDDGSGSDITVISLSDTDDEGEPEEPEE